MQIEIAETLRQTGETRLPQTVIFSLLSSPHRRQVLSHLSRCDGAVTADELAEVICAHEGATRPEYRLQVERGLAYVHLPKLTHAGVVDYRPDLGTVELTPSARQLLDHLTRRP